MKPLLTFCLSFLILSAVSQTSADTLNWYKCMKGTIAKYPITMQLHKKGHEYSGSYYYESSQEPISISGNDSLGIIVISAYIPHNIDDDNTQGETFRGKWTGDIYSGTWKQSGKSSSQAFTLQSQTSATKPDFIIVYTEGKTKLRPQLKKSPEANFSASSVWPTGNSITDVFMKKELTKIFSNKDTTKEIGKVLLESKKQFFKEYSDEQKDVTQKDINDNSESMNWDTQSDARIAFRSTKLLCISVSDYSYTGGAHGNYGTSFYAYDVKNRKRLQLEDVINMSDSVSLSVKLEDKFRRLNHLKPTEKLSTVLFEDSIWPNDNFFVTEKGIIFNYNPYEIAAYVYGEISLFIPFTEISSLLKDDFVTLLKN